MATAKKGAFPALRATLAGVAAKVDSKVARDIEARLGRAERLAESRLRTINRLLEKLRACRVENRKRVEEQRRLADLVELGKATEERLRSLLADARRVIHESGEVQDAQAAILEAERRRRIECDQRLAGALALLHAILDDGALDDGASEETRAQCKGAIRAFLGLDEPGADGPVGGLLSKLGK